MNYKIILSEAVNREINSSNVFFSQLLVEYQLFQKRAKTRPITDKERYLIFMFDLYTFKCESGDNKVYCYRNDEYIYTQL